MYLLVIAKTGRVTRYEVHQVCFTPKGTILQGIFAPGCKRVLTNAL